MEKYSVKNIYNSIPAEQRGKTLNVEVPGSKSITNRALLIATLAEGESCLDRVLFSDDSRNFLKCVQDLGIETAVDEEKKTVIIHGCGGRIPKKEASLYVGSAGTAARFLTAVLGVSDGTYKMDSSEQMKKRPMGPLLDSLRELGCEIDYEGAEGHFPFTLKGKGFGKDNISINIDSSSQFLSALLIASVLSKEDFRVDVLGSHGMSYIDMTVKMMEQFGAAPGDIVRSRGSKTVGADAENSDDDKTKSENDDFQIKYRISHNMKFLGRSYDIEPDASGAAYFYAMCPLLNILVAVPGIREDSLQGDVEFIHILEKMGCRIDVSDSDILLLPPESGKFSGVEADMHACSDQAITLAAIAPFAESPTTITGIGHIRLQESDRLSAIVTELGRMGIKTENGDDWIRIYPGAPEPAEIETYEDHRMAMGFSLVGLRTDGIVIKDPLCCRKTFEDYFEVLDRVIGELTDS